jgi:hypothetical protein
LGKREERREGVREERREGVREERGECPPCSMIRCRVSFLLEERRKERGKGRGKGRGKEERQKERKENRKKISATRACWHRSSPPSPSSPQQSSPLIGCQNSSPKTNGRKHYKLFVAQKAGFQNSKCGSSSSRRCLRCACPPEQSSHVRIPRQKRMGKSICSPKGWLPNLEMWILKLKKKSQI